MRFHILGLPHTITSKEYNACAFTQKILKLCAMLHRAGYTVIHYGHSRSEVECTEHVAITDDAVLEATYGSYDWKANHFKFDANDFAHKVHQSRAIEEVAKRKQPDDFLLCIWWQNRVAEAHKDLIVVDPGIGNHRKTWAPFNVFESYAVMHGCYALGKQDLPKWYDCVIPNYFNPDDFEYKTEKQDYLLYLARITSSKGLQVAVDLARLTNKKLIVAGQGSYEEVMKAPAPEYVEVIGYADVSKRKELLANACALVQASYYAEPFGGCVVEAMLSGTPVLTSDWGAFPELVLHGKTGFRCRTMDHFVFAVNHLDQIKPEVCRAWAMNNFSMERVVKMYEEYFQMLLSVKQGKGFYDITDRTELGWLSKEYP